MVNADLMDAIDRCAAPGPAAAARAVRRRAGRAVRRPVPARARAAATPTSAPTSPTPTARCGSSTRRCGSEADLRIFELGEIHRQHDDDVQGDAERRAARPGHGRDRRRAQRRRARAARCPSDGAITLATRNDTVNRINRSAAAPRCPGQSQTATRPRSTATSAAGRYPADENLELKVGAQVMFLRNDTAIGDGRAG